MRKTLQWAALFVASGGCALAAAQAVAADDGVAHAVDGAPVFELRSDAVAVSPAPRAPDLAALVIGLEATETPPDALLIHEPPQVGYVVPAPESLTPAAGWEAAPDGGWVARFEFVSPGAQGLRLQLADPFRIPVEVRLYGPFDDQQLGPYTFGVLGDDLSWWSPTITGDTIGLELYLPPMPEDDGLPPIPAVTAVAHLFAEEGCDCATGPGSAFSCHNDVSCFADWANDARAVGQISFISGGGCFICTGALLNRNPSDNGLLFMTANHCISTQSEANTLEVRWLYQTDSCNGTIPGFNTVPRSNGAVLLKRRSSADWTLLGLIDRPGGLWLLGWNSGSWASFDVATGIHHPAGTRKRISFGVSAGSTDDATFCDDSGQNCFDVDVWNVSYTNGTTQGGSSGSPIFDSNHRVRGTLTGGQSGCAPITKRYGRLDLAYTNLRYYLYTDYIASPVFVWNAAVSDPGNNGNLERGTVTSPFNTVREATYAVRANDTVRILPGNYSERFTITRPMRLERQGNSGVVRIGQ